MPAKRIFVLNAHPAPQSLSRRFAEAYGLAARDAGHDVRIANISDLSFDIDFGRAGYGSPKPLEPDLERVLEEIEWAQHMVLTTPMWWGGLPAKLKGLFDRAFLPGRTFDTRQGPGKLPKPLLSGRTARVVMTSDTPGWYLRLVYRNAIVHQLGKQILGFVGLRPTRFTHFSGASHPTAARVDAWTDVVRNLGRAGA